MRYIASWEIESHLFMNEQANKHVYLCDVKGGRERERALNLATTKEQKGGLVGAINIYIFKSKRKMENIYIEREEKQKSKAFVQN